MNPDIIQRIVLMILPLIFAITLHEAAHGWVAMKLGDKTALMLGRVSLNPVRHIDLFGTVILPILMLLVSPFLFGWAKPVPITYQNLNKPKRDMALVALAGPLANLLMAILWALIARLASQPFFLHAGGFVTTAAQFFVLVGQYGVMINVVLMVLNLVPLPPLDGSRVVASLLPNGPVLAAYSRIEPYGVWILLALLVTGVLAYVIFPPIQWLIHWITAIFMV